jgi:hypothetical protein
MNIGHYAKSLLYIALAAVTFLVTALADSVIETQELINLGIILAGAIGVYLVPNLPDSVAKYGKGAVAVATAALIAILSFLGDGISTSEWLQVGIAALAAIGVVIVPNESKIPVVATVDAVVVPAPEDAH